MAKIFNKQNKIASFNNYAKSGATISQWLKLFNINYPGQNDAGLNIFGNSPQEIKDFQTKVLSDLKNKFNNSNPWWEWFFWINF